MPAIWSQLLDELGQDVDGESVGGNWLGKREEGPSSGGGEHRQEGEARMVGGSTTVPCTAGAVLPTSAPIKPTVGHLREPVGSEAKKSCLISFV